MSRKIDRFVTAGSLAAVMMLAACDSPLTADRSGLSEAEKSRAAEAFVNCMAEGGVQAQVEYSANSITINVHGDADEATMLELEASCEHHLNELDGGGGPQMSPEEEAELADALVEVQRCLADAGYDVDISGGGIGIESEGDDDDFDEAAYLEVENACFEEAVPELYEKYGEG